MKKCFISVPMRGRTDTDIYESIVRLNHMAKLIFGEDVECVDNFQPENPTELGHQPLWYLGEAIKKMADCDCMLGPSAPYGVWPGCTSESDVARNYHIKVFEYPAETMFPDVAEVVKKYYAEEGVTIVKAESCKED